jgi:two-component system, cell cycle response regulator DivK
MYWAGKPRFTLRFPWGNVKKQLENRRYLRFRKEYSLTCQASADGAVGAALQPIVADGRWAAGSTTAWDVRMAKTVLIVEDNELNMKLFHDLLEAHGYHTVGTRNGVEALDLARQHRPDLILMDIQLPEVSGLEVTRWLKDDPDLKAIPVVAVTAFAMKGDEERIREGGCEAYLSKPISVGKFIETIRQFLGQA